ncbi:hypothetical protein EYF80_051344 [Liparis tanakae]|uniref:Uncharacterized protein n=1 Tax=Liparis tanakae TaxID=230148 RepID=A0A4Z2FB54_9TELE|nr:hypothetical protein EYF80_051344 [Liparis tanakae]
MGLTSMPLSRSRSPWVKNSPMMRSVHWRYSSRGLVGAVEHVLQNLERMENMKYMGNMENMKSMKTPRLVTFFVSTIVFMSARKFMCLDISVAST